ncbi:dTDP-4-dehydrorhamnose reductase [uncultured Clostridium sp.]|nr:dTDP-4-dehydrorhamnose reductase [uncultured Clostridium sp.]
MRVIITGAKGQLGLELTKQLNIKSDYEVIPTDREELNILDMKQVSEFILKIKPDVVINCAAHTAVDLCETDIDNAYRINALGPRNLAIACEKVGSKFV